eukprot:TRINITY_DN5283_c1_g1_i5.p1 TRINITY_DN5283_c1_g1~~TRINITY_DN5283_c1_g1_i5.p1  ORF type:complete len:625 (+),score=51.66 TRINITY_DN5283_c1_g1_i5:164-1876(+)
MLQDFHYLRNKVKREMEAFMNLGYKMIVVIDAVVDVSKIKEWVEQRLRELETLKEINTHLRDKPGTPLPEDMWFPSNSAGVYLAQAFENAGCEVLFSHVNAHKEAAYLALKYSAYAVVTSDTDFLMFPGIKILLDPASLDLQENGALSIDATIKHQVQQKLGIVEEDMPYLAGILGNDVVPHLSNDEKQQLVKDYGGHHPVVAAALHLKLNDDIKQSERCQIATKCYEAAEPIDQPDGNLLRLAAVTKNVYMRGVAIEDTTRPLAQKVLSPLRLQVYTKLGLKRIVEHICIPGEEEAVLEGIQVIPPEDGSVEAFEEPPTSAEELVATICDYLRLRKALPELYSKALQLQLTKRIPICQTYNANRALRPQSVQLEALHFQNLFLQALEIFRMGSDDALPPCWDMFHVEAYHFLCQNWGYVDKPHLLIFEQPATPRTPRTPRSYNSSQRGNHTPRGPPTPRTPRGQNRSGDGTPRYSGNPRWQDNGERDMEYQRPIHGFNRGDQRTPRHIPGPVLGRSGNDVGRPPITPRRNNDRNGYGKNSGSNSGFNAFDRRYSSSDKGNWTPRRSWDD